MHWIVASNIDKFKNKRKSPKKTIQTFQTHVLPFSYIWYVSTLFKELNEQKSQFFAFNSKRFTFSFDSTDKIMHSHNKFVYIRMLFRRYLLWILLLLLRYTFIVDNFLLGFHLTYTIFLFVFFFLFGFYRSIFIWQWSECLAWSGAFSKLCFLYVWAREKQKAVTQYLFATRNLKTTAAAKKPQKNLMLSCWCCISGHHVRLKRIS